MIIYDEYQYCKHLLETKVKKILQRDLNYLAKYWAYEGLKNSQIEGQLKSWCLWQNEYFNFDALKNRWKIKKALSHAKKFKFRPLVSISISQSELKVIESIGDYKLEKVVFVMLATARFFKYTETRKKPKNTAMLIGTYYNHSFMDAVKIAGVTMNLRERDDARYKLKSLGLVDPILFTNNPYKQEVSYRLNFSDETAIPAILINDWRNIVAYYQEYKGENIIACCNCGTKISKRNNKQKLCKKCRKIIDRKVFDWGFAV